MNFGPLNGEGGERRLNVLITRASCAARSSRTSPADDIDLERTRSRGVAALKMFLTFAQTGRLGSPRRLAARSGSVFEEQVADAAA